jgi:isoprenylcysteine carboxyl methyltransferase (ICMT) family protein YpbQ
MSRPDLMKLEIILPIASVLVINTVRIKELLTRRGTIPGYVKESLTLKLFILAGTLMPLCSIAEFFLLGYVLSWPTFILGWLIALISFSIRWSAIRALGKFWSLNVEIRESHEFVQSGPFRWMRHPAYFSIILELVSAGLILNAKFSFLVGFLLFAPSLWLRIRLEEQALVEKFGARYQQYIKDTPALVPYKWPRTNP